MYAIETNAQYRLTLEGISWALDHWAQIPHSPVMGQGRSRCEKCGGDWSAEIHTME